MVKNDDLAIEHEVLSYMEGIYVNELFWLLTAIKSNCERLFEIAKVPETGFIIQVDIEAHSLIKLIITNSSHVANLIDPRTKKKDENEERYQFRKERGEFLKKIFNVIVIEEILQRELRDSIEHFDERLDNLVHSVSKKARKKDQSLAHNMVFSKKAVLQPFPIPVRVYVSAEKIFYNMNWRLDIGKIYTECVSMLDAVQNLEKIKKIKEPGGMIVIVPKLTDSSPKN